MAGPVLTDAMWNRASSVDGWYARKEAELLFSATRGPWVEIGSWKGLSTAVLGQTEFPGWAVDTFTGSSEHGTVDTYDEFMEHIKGLPVTVVRGDYRDVYRKVPRGALMLHIDHEHTYEDTKRAFKLYAPRLGRNARIALHDAWWYDERDPDSCPWPGVTRFALELLDHPEWRLWDDCFRLAVFERR